MIFRLLVNMNQELSDATKRFLLYKEANHIPNAEIKKYKFDKIQYDFDIKKTDDWISTKIKIKYYKHFPQISNYAILNCANSDSLNAGYRIDHCVTQEVQLFYDTDVFAAYFKDFYPFNFKNELLYAKNVTFHNNDGIQWDQNCLRQNDVIFAASKKLKRSCETVEIKTELERIIEPIFKVAYINKKLNLLLWPIGCGVFKNDQRIIAELFSKSIKANIGYFKEIVMVIYDPKRADKRFNDCFIAELNKRQLCYRIN